MSLTFEWDEKKAEINIEKHGVSFVEVKSVFNDPIALTIFDPDHSIDEDRFIDIGLSLKGRILVVSYTERGEHIRFISSRPATAKERRVYEKKRR